ncbi:hypothetical protein IFR05_011473 [Cadophora sp. M221]|nr:hypothetical protein IFR05_011473 [Cadophora sp. M221]
MSSSTATWEPSLLPDLTGRIALITGGHSGLGLATTTHLVAKNAKVYIASRSLPKAAAAVRHIKDEHPAAQVEILEMDLADLKSVKRGADEFMKKERHLHILINNAGIMCPPYSRTAQGIETQFQTNYLSHYLLTSLLLPTLLTTARNPQTPANTVRIVNVSSDGHAKLAPKAGVSFGDVNLENASSWTRYGHSKLCQVLHAKALGQMYGRGEGQGGELVAVSLHPGTVKTDLSKGPRASTWWYRFIQPVVEKGAPGPEKGCWGIVWCAASKELGEKMSEKVVDINGGYFEGVGILSKASKSGEDIEMAKTLWVWSEERLTELDFLDCD